MIKGADCEKRYCGMHIKYSDLHPVELLCKMIHYSRDNKGARLIQYSDKDSAWISLLKYPEWHVCHYGQLEFSIFVPLFFPDLTGSLRFRQNGHRNNGIFCHIYIYCNTLTSHKQKIVPLKAEEYMQSDLYLSPVLALLLIN